MEHTLAKINLDLIEPQQLRFRYNRGTFFPKRVNHNGRLIYQDCSALGRSNDADDETALVVPLHDDDDVINKMNLVAGLYNNEQIWLDDVHEASVVETSSVDDCVLKVKQLAPDLTLCIGHKHHLSVKRFHYD